MTELEQLSKKGYEAYTTSLTAPGSGAPACFSPMHWLELEVFVRTSFIHATGQLKGLYTKASPVGESDTFWARFAHEQYRQNMEAQGHHLPSWEVLTIPLRNAWVAYTKQILTTFRAQMN